MSDAHTLMRLNREAQAKLAERAAPLDEREARLRAELDKVLAQKVELNGEREALARAEQVYRRLFGLPAEEAPTLSSFRTIVPSLSAQISGHEPTRPRARLGPQRYLMFDALSKEGGGMSLNALAVDTRLNARRIKDQMVSDLRLGMVTGDDNLYRLTPAGKDLLDRYRAYKKAHNQPLPSRDDPSTEDDHDESETEDMMEGATQE